jgi:hypothetical protein
MGPPISTKKLIEEGTWKTRKEILGWMLDGITRTISLPQPKYDKILLKLKAIRHSKCVPFNRLEKLQGKLTFAAISIQVGKPLLGQSDKFLAIANKSNFNNITVNTIVKQYCTTWTSLLKLMSSRPTHVRELTPRTTASYQGLRDASSWGVGGVWFPGFLTLAPLVWYWECPLDVRNNLVTANNPNGTISISDLELMGILMQFLVLEQAVPTLQHQSPAIWCDNNPAVAWFYKFRTIISHLAPHILLAIATILH